GKDGHPFPVPLAVYDRTIRVMKDAVEGAKLGNDDRLAALRTLDAHARALEHRVEDVDFEGLLAEERARSPEYDGHSVQGWAGRPRKERARSPKDRAPQLTLPLDVDPRARRAP